MDSENKGRENVLLPDNQLTSAESPQGVDRRTFMMRSAVAGAVAVMTGCAPSTPQQSAPQARGSPTPAAPPL